MTAPTQDPAQLEPAPKDSPSAESVLATIERITEMEAECHEKLERYSVMKTELTLYYGERLLASN